MSDVNVRFLGGRADIRCIEPYPPPYLTPLPGGIAELVPSRVQDVPLETFDRLGPGDVLFIDSSHSVQDRQRCDHLMFEVLPRLAAGVHVHFHDIFLPFDYPRGWVLKWGCTGTSSMVRALLTLNSGFRITFGSTYASVACAEDVVAALSLSPGSIYVAAACGSRRSPTLDEGRINAYDQFSVIATLPS